MSDTTTLLHLPYILASQAQKHVTHNDALLRLDAVVQLAVHDRDLAVPPATPAEGDRYIVATAASGVWAGKVGQIAAWQDGAWNFYPPQNGWLAWVMDEQTLLGWNGSAWHVAALTSVNPVALVGINTTADATNKLAVKANAVLLSHDDVTPGSGDMRAVINKSGAAKTASLLFQDGYSGRVEAGLCGDDNWHVKVSTDGASWREAVIAKWGHVTNGVQIQLGDLPTGLQNGTALHLGTGHGISFMAEYTAALGSGGGAGIVGAVTNLPTAADQRLGYFLLGSRNGASGINNQAGLIAFANEAWTSGTSHATYLQLVTTPTGSAARVPRFRVEAAGHLRPEADNAYTLGNASYRVASVWAANGTIQTSDARDKQVIGDLPFAAAMVDAIEPKLFRWNNGGSVVRASATETATGDDGEQVPAMEVVAQPGVRAHAGFLAQDIKAAMDAAEVDFGAWGLDDKNNPESRQWTRPDQLIAVLWAALRETREELRRLRG